MKKKHLGGSCLNTFLNSRMILSCTTRDVYNLVNNGINYLSTGAGFFPSTVSSLNKYGSKAG